MFILAELLDYPGNFARVYFRCLPRCFCVLLQGVLFSLPPFRCVLGKGRTKSVLARVSSEQMAHFRRGNELLGNYFCPLGFNSNSALYSSSV